MPYPDDAPDREEVMDRIEHTIATVLPKELIYAIDTFSDYDNDTDGVIKMTVVLKTDDEGDQI